MKRYIIAFVALSFLWGCTGADQARKKEEARKKEQQEQIKRDREQEQLRLDALKKAQIQKKPLKKAPKFTEKQVQTKLDTVMGRYQQDKQQKSVAPSDYLKELMPYAPFGTVELLFNVATFEMKLDQFQNAYKHYIKALKKNPHHVESLINIAYLGYKNGNIAQVLPFFTATIQKQQREHKIDKALFNNYAVLLLLNKSHEKALSTAQTILAHDPLNIPAYRTIAYLYIQTKQFLLGEKIIDLALSYVKKDNKKKSSLFVMKAKLYQATQESSKMMAAYKMALKLDPYNVDANFAISALFLKYGAGQQATKYLARLVKRYPSQAAFRNLLAISLRMARFYDKALNEYNQIIELEPEYHFAYYNKGILLEKYLSKPDQAIKAYEQYQRVGGKRDISGRIKVCRQMIESLKALGGE